MIIKKYDYIYVTHIFKLRDVVKIIGIYEEKDNNSIIYKVESIDDKEIRFIEEEEILAKLEIKEGVDLCQKKMR